MGAILLPFGYWKSVLISFMIIVFILKVVDVVGRKFGHNILRTDQEMPLYPLRLILISIRPSKHHFVFQHQDCHTVKLHTSQRIFLQFCDSHLVYCIILPTGGLGQGVAPRPDGGHV